MSRRELEQDQGFPQYLENIYPTNMSQGEGIIITYIADDCFFYIQRHQKYFEELCQIQRMLLPVKRNYLPNQPQINVEHDVTYAVYYEKYNRFLRGKVVQVNGNSVVVNFLEYGFTYSVSVKCFRPLPSLLKYPPPLAEKCRFLSQNYLSRRIRNNLIGLLTDGKMCQAVFSNQQENDVLCIESLYHNDINVCE